MRSVFFLLLLGCLNTLGAQTASGFHRKGFIFGAGAGISNLHVSTTGQPSRSLIAASFPNFKFGTMVTSKAAIALCLPGTVYSFTGSGRVRDRGFEGIIPSFQYWPKDRWWVLGGAGLTLDAPAFYDIKDETERKFYFGPSVLAGTGYELWRKKKFALDIQARMHYGTANVPEGTRKGLAFTVLLGFNWY